MCCGERFVGGRTQEGTIWSKLAFYTPCWEYSKGHGVENGGSDVRGLLISVFMTGRWKEM